MFHPRSLSFAALPLLCAALAAQSVVTRHGQIVFAAGQPMPSSRGASANDFPAGAVLRAAGLGAAGAQPLVDGDGAMLFRANAALDATLGIDATNSIALLHGRDGGDLRMIVRAGDSIAGLPATTRFGGLLPFRQIGTSSFDRHLMIVVTLVDTTVPANTPTTADTAILLGQPGALQLLMREGEPVAALGGARFGDIDTTALNVNSSGRVAVRNKLQTGFGGVTTANDGIVVVGTVGNLTTMLREGSPWNGVGASGEVVAFAPGVEFPVRSLRQFDDGRVLHDVHFVVPSGPVTSVANDSALAIWDAGVDRILVREGDPAPGMPTGVVFAENGNTSFALLPTGAMNKSGEVVFTTFFPLGPGGVTSADDTALYLHDGTQLSLILREGSPSPLGGGALYGTVSSSVQRNDAGQWLFATTLTGAVTGTDNSAVFFGTTGSLTAIAREGDPVPGLPGHVFDDLTLATPALNDHGHALLLAPVTNGTGRTIVLQYTPAHGLRIFFDPLDPFVAPAGTATLGTSFAASLFPASDHCTHMLNNQGDVAFVAACTGAEATTIGCTWMRCRAGSLHTTPATVPATGGVPQQFAIDCGPQQGNRFYFVIASSLGTRPGFPSPLGPQLVPLNFDPTWTNLSVSFVNTAVWSGTFGFTDANGVGVGPASFTLPTGVPGLAGLALHHAAVLFDTTLVSTFVTEPAGLLLR